MRHRSVHHGSDQVHKINRALMLKIWILEPKYEKRKRKERETNLSGFNWQIAAREPLKVLLQQSLGIVLSDLLACHFQNLISSHTKSKSKSRFRSKPISKIKQFERKLTKIRKRKQKTAIQINKMLEKMYIITFGKERTQNFVLRF